MHLDNVVAGIGVWSQVKIHRQFLLAEAQSPQVLRSFTDGPHKVAALVAEGDPAGELHTCMQGSNTRAASRRRKSSIGCGRLG